MQRVATIMASPLRWSIAVCAALSQTLLPLQSQALDTTVAAPSPAGSAVPSAEQQYITSVAAMRALDLPPFVTYRSSWKSTGLGFAIAEDDKRIVIDVGVGSKDFKKAQEYAINYRGSDRRLGVSPLPGGTQFTGEGPFLDPTWTGAYAILRYGLRGAPPASRATPSPQPSASGDAAPIASVVAISAANYRVEDRGAGTCPVGTPGRVLKLVAYRDPQAHPLTEVTIDPATDRFCNMRFNLKEPGLAGVTGDYAFHFAPIGPYWLVSGGIIDISVRVLGIAANHTVLTWENSGVTTPADIPASAFIDPAPAPTPSTH